jgi:hypothetical protein
MVKLNVGDPVIVNDPLLIQLGMISGNRLMNRGWVHEILDDGDIMVEFPIGDQDPDEHSQVAPYPAEMVRYDSLGLERK